MGVTARLAFSSQMNWAAVAALLGTILSRSSYFSGSILFFPDRLRKGQRPAPSEEVQIAIGDVRDVAAALRAALQESVKDKLPTVQARGVVDRFFYRQFCHKPPPRAHTFVSGPGTDPEIRLLN